MPAGDYNITLEELLKLLDAISSDVAQQGSLLNEDYRAWYDTPFYDQGGNTKGNICVQGLGCFARQELNYIAQGEASAREMEGTGLMAMTIVGWKFANHVAYPSVYPSAVPSLRTMQAASIGYGYHTLTHPLNLVLVGMPYLRNPIPFISTVSNYIQGNYQ
jgi:hypothetical protein